MPDSLPISRRQLLTAAALTPLLAACTTQLTTTDRGITVTGVMHSAATGSDQDWAVWYPPGHTDTASLPVVVFLHGYGDTIAMAADLDYPGVLIDLFASGATPFALAAINGQTWFWQKTAGKNAGAMVATEFVSMLAERGLDTSRLGLTGISMGGWGTFRLACDELHGKLRAIATVSAPCYQWYDYTPHRELLTRAEFDKNNFYTRPQRLADLPIFMACGTEDPFVNGNRDFAEILSKTPGVQPPQTDFQSGEHNAAYWKRVAAAQFGFLAAHL